MIKLVAFDWNGTILSDTNAALKAENFVLKKFVLKPINLRTFQQTYTMPIKNFWLATGFDEISFNKNINKIYQNFQSCYEPLENKCRSRSGTKNLLKWLKKQQVIPIIYSNHIKPHILKQLKRLGLIHLIDDIIARPTKENMSHLFNKSKAKELNLLVKKYKLNPKEVISVGDTEEEIEIGHKYGYHTIALTNGYQSLKRLKASKPDYIINNLNQIIGIIKNLNEHT